MTRMFPLCTRTGTSYPPPPLSVMTRSKWRALTPAGSRHWSATWVVPSVCVCVCVCVQSNSAAKHMYCLTGVCVHHCVFQAISTCVLHVCVCDLVCWRPVRKPVRWVCDLHRNEASLLVWVGRRLISTLVFLPWSSLVFRVDGLTQ